MNITIQIDDGDLGHVKSLLEALQEADYQCFEDIYTLTTHTRTGPFCAKILNAIDEIENPESEEA